MSDTTGDRMIRVDMTNQTATIEAFPEDWKLLGGRGLSARILLEECDASCDPLGPDNLLVMAPGVLSGTSAPTSGRISIGGKSPLTGGIKEANAGGNPGQDLMRLGFRVVVVTGQPADPERRYALLIDADSAAVIPADEHKGKWNYALIEDLAKSYSETASFISIGPAGEMRLAGASVACTDQEKQRNPARHAGRGGLGAVMGSKGLKYVAVDAGKRPARKPANKKEFGALCKKYTKYFIDGPGQGTVSEVGHERGLCRSRRALHFSIQESGRGALSRCPYARRDAHRGELRRARRRHAQLHDGLHRQVQQRRPRQGWQLQDLRARIRNPHVARCELCGIASWEDVADLDRLCDEIGLDTIETGAAIAVYMDSGGYGVWRRGRRQGDSARNRGGDRPRAVDRKWRRGDRPKAQAPPGSGRQGASAARVGSPPPQGFGDYLLHERDGCRSHGGAHRRARAAAGGDGGGLPAALRSSTPWWTRRASVPS